MPKHLAGRPPCDAREERQVSKLSHSRHESADWIFHAKIVARRWDGLRTRQIADELAGLFAPGLRSAIPEVTFVWS